MFHYAVTETVSLGRLHYFETTSDTQAHSMLRPVDFLKATIIGVSAVNSCFSSWQNFSGSAHQQKGNYYRSFDGK